jgi:hypothetical protein
MSIKLERLTEARLKELYEKFEKKKEMIIINARETGKLEREKEEFIKQTKTPNIHSEDAPIYQRDVRATSDT